MRWVLPLLTVLPGCIFNMSRTDRATPDCGDRIVKSVEIPAEADSCSASGAAAGIKYGAFSICNIGTAINTAGIFRFSLPPTGTIFYLSLNIAHATKSNECAPSCGSCGFIEHDGLLTLAYMRSDWSEADATWVNRGTDPWGSDGASAVGVDRSPTIATVDHSKFQAAVFDSQQHPAMIAILGTWRTINQLSFHLLPANGAVFVAATRHQPGTDCPAPGYARPTLTVAYCL